jgi:hypothetical protein
MFKIAARREMNGISAFETSIAVFWQSIEGLVG